MNNQPTIGIAIMAYKYDMFVAQAIDSVLAQTKKPDQIIVVDDESHDDTSDIVARYDLPLIQREINLGPIANFQDVLMNEFTADYCMFLGADNWLHPQYIEKTLALMLDKNVSIVSTDIFLVGEYAKQIMESHNGRIDNGYIILESDVNNLIASNHHGSSLFNLQHSKDIGGFNPLTNQTLFWDRLHWKNMYAAGYTGTHVSEPLLYYRQHRFNFNQWRWSGIGESLYL